MDTNEDVSRKSLRARRNKLTPEEEQLIKGLYSEGYTYREISESHHFSVATIARLVRGTRNPSEANKLSRSKGRGKITDRGRRSLQEQGKKSCQRVGKVYTKPEQGLKVILNSIGIGVRFPVELKEKIGVSDDDTGKYHRFICFQYPLQRYVLDFVDVDNKVAINVNGDYWHANPVLYSPDKLGKLQKHNIRTDKNKRVFLEKHGWTVLDIWESEIAWNVGLVIDKLRAAGITEARRDYTPEDRVQFPSRLPDWSDKLRELWYKQHPAADPNYVKVDKERSTHKRGVCGHCGKEFSYISSRSREYCSVSCTGLSRARVHVTATELISKLKELGSYTRVGKYFGVSDNTIKKYCRKLGVLDEATKIVRANMSELARQQHLNDPSRILRVGEVAAAKKSESVPYFVATSRDTGEELCRFATYADLEAAGFSSAMVLKACRGERKTYKKMQWHREKKSSE